MKKIIAILSVIACFGSAFAGFSKYVPISVTGYTGAAVSDFQILVHIDETKLPGFYSDVQNAGADLKFTDATGLTEYPYEVDVWNPDGESLVWVKIPSLHGGDCAFRMYYGDIEKTSNLGSTDVWSGYFGVWHFNPDLRDSSPNAYHGTDCNTVGSTNGPVGVGRTISNSTTDGDPVGAIKMLTSAGLQHGATFTWSGWINTTVDHNGEYMALIEKRPQDPWTKSQGFEIYWNGNWVGHGFGMGGDNGQGTIRCFAGDGKNASDLLNDGRWHHVVITFANGVCSSYRDGVRIENEVSISQAQFSDNDYILVFGNASSVETDKIGTSDIPADASRNGTFRNPGSAFKGSLDEYRLSPGVMGIDRIAADYLTQTTDMTTFGTPVELSSSTVIFSADITSGFVPITNVFTVVTDGLSGSMTYAWDLDGDGETDIVTSVPTLTHEWTERGTYTVKLKVTDEYENSAEAAVPDYVCAKGMVYVDANAAAGGDGSVARPFKSIKAAADDVTSEETILIRGGADRQYEILTYNDSVVLPLHKTHVSIRGCDADWVPISDWSQTNDMAKVWISNEYSKASCILNGGWWNDNKDYYTPDYESPFCLFGQDCVISGLRFEFGQESFKSQYYGGTGLINVDADNIIIESCAFIMTDSQGHYGGAGTRGVIYGVSDLATNCKMRRNYVKLGKRSDEIAFFGRLRTDVLVVENYFENIDAVLGAGIDTASGVWVNVISNTFLNCASTSTIGYGGNGYPYGGEIAYNRAIHNNGGDGTYYFLRYGSQYNGSWKSADTKIHHNTIVGYDAMFYSPKYQGKTNPYTWQPLIFDNIMILPGGEVIIADAIGMWPNTNNEPSVPQSGSPFREGSEFRCNALLAGAFGGGTMMVTNATSDIFANLGYTNTTINLTSAPVFMNTTDVRSPNYYRIKCDSSSWAAKGGYTYEGAYPRYIGAVEPLVSGGVMLFVR